MSLDSRRRLRVRRFSVVAVFCFAGLLGYALYKLQGLQTELSTDVGENMVWAISQAVYQSGRFYQASLMPPTAASHSAQVLHRNLLKARLLMLTSGRQRDYMKRAGVLPELQRGVAMLEQSPLNHGGLQQLLQQVGNQVMISDRVLAGAQRDAHNQLMVQVMLAVLGVLFAGALLCWQLLISQRRASAGYVEIARQHAQTRELLEAVQQERANKLRYRDFVSLMSHQFRTPLAVIDSSAQRLLRQLHGNELAQNVSERAQRIRKSVDQLNQLIGRVLEGLRLDEELVGNSDLSSLDIRRCDWREVVNEALERFAELPVSRPLLLCGIAADEGALWVDCDRMWCVEILSNLLSNADKYSPAAQPIDVTVEVSEGMLSCSVRDYGQGIAESELSRVFERFYRGERTQSYVGIGLGLSIARTLAHWHGGSLTVRNDEQGGACFTLVLPLHAAVPQAAPH